jgi:assimilatory nitrate reductase catalytic subunit
MLTELSAGQPCDISGIKDYAMLEEAGGVQWPYPAGSPPIDAHGRERRLFADGRFFHPDGRARLVCAPPRALPEPTDERYPLMLITGRGSSSQWHTQTRTGKSAVLARLAPQALYVEVNPADARRLGLEPGALVAVESRRATVRARLFVTHAVRAGEVFMPMHYAETNQLTLAAFDPESRQPAYKACAVALRSLPTP